MVTNLSSSRSCSKEISLRKLRENKQNNYLYLNKTSNMTSLRNLKKHLNQGDKQEGNTTVRVPSNQRQKRSQGTPVSQEEMISRLKGRIRSLSKNYQINLRRKRSHISKLIREEDTPKKDISSVYYMKKMLNSVFEVSKIQRDRKQSSKRVKRSIIERRKIINLKKSKEKKIIDEESSRFKFQFIENLKAMGFIKQIVQNPDTPIAESDQNIKLGPPKFLKRKRFKTVILDLDETLIHFNAKLKKGEQKSLKEMLENPNEFKVRPPHPPII